ncbi:MAG: hypothetical protein ACLFSQ_11110 [Candidatus Zixiibacteriota bacterium]
MSFTNDHQVINSNRYNLTAVNGIGFNSTGQKPLFCVPHIMPAGVKGVAIDDIIIVSDTATASSSDTKKYAFQIKDKTNSNELLETAIDTDSDGEIAADTSYRLTPEQNNTSLGGGTVLELDITMTGSPTDLSSAEVTAYVHWHWEV